jgi:predicted nucleotidyltransferase
MLELFFRSGAEVKVLGVVLFSDGLHLREIARQAAVSSFEAKRELDMLVRTGVLTREEKGRQVFFSISQNCPFLPELRGLYTKTEGVVPALARALAMPGIKYSFIFGSFAGGRQRSHSDIDLMVVGDAAEKAVAGSVFAVQQETGREINFILWTPAELDGKLSGNSAFLKNIAGDKLIWIRGDRDEFVRAVKEGPRKKGRT